MAERPLADLQGVLCPDHTLRCAVCGVLARRLLLTTAHAKPLCERCARALLDQR